MYLWVSQVISLSLRFPTKFYIRRLSPHTRYMPRPSHSSRLYHPNNSGRAIQIIMLLITYFSHTPVTSSLLGTNILPNTLSLRSSLNVSDQVAHPYKTTSKVIFLDILIFVGRGAQSVERQATGRTVRGSNPGGGEFFAHVQTGPGAHSASYIMGTGFSPGVELTTHLLLAPRSIPSLGLWWAVIG
jgi:hypothetical protein